MPDRAAHSMPFKKPIPNSLRLKYRYANTAADLVNRLPIQSHLDSSQELLVSLAPIWSQWCSSVFGSQQPESTELSSSERELDCRLKAIKHETLIVACTSSSKATLIKNQQGSLLDAIHKRGYSQLKRVRVVMELPTQSVFEQLASARQHQQQKTVRQRPSYSAIEAVESAAKASENQGLSHALTRLANTLRKA